MKLYFVLLSLLFISTFSFGQAAAYEWGKLSPQEKKMTIYDQDSTATAVLLIHAGKMVINKSSFTLRYYKRIKILKETAFDLADVSLPYYTHDNTERIGSIKARITLPNNTSINLGKKDFFDKKINDYWKAKTFAFPKVVEGAILEYEYTVESNDLFNLRPFYFQEKYPIVLSKLTIIPNEEMNYAVILQNNQDGKVEEKSKWNTLTYTLHHVPAFKEEPYVTCFDDYYIKIMFQLSFYQRAYLTDWKKTANTLKHEFFFGQQYLKKRNFKNALAEVFPLIKEGSSPKEKTKIIYQYLNQVLQWNGQYYYTVEKTLSEVYENKIGRSGELNLLLTALLKEVGVDADPVLISTRSNGKMIQDYPIMEQFNHVLSHVTFGEETWLLDLSNKHRPINYIRPEALNYYGWLVKDKAPEWIKISAPFNTEVYNGNFKLLAEGTLEGLLTVKQKGYTAFADRASIEAKEIGTIWQQRLEKQWPEIKIQDLSFKQEQEIEEVLETQIPCIIEDASMQVDDFLYLKPMIYSSWNENLFKSPERLYSVDFPYPIREIYAYTIHLPANYTIEELPKSIKFSMPGEEGFFSYMLVQKEDHTISVSAQFTLKEVFFPAYKYATLRAFFDIVSDKMQEQIVLKKIE